MEVLYCCGQWSASKERACAAKAWRELLSLFSQNSLDVYTKNDSLPRNNRQQHIMHDGFSGCSPNKYYIHFTASGQTHPRIWKQWNVFLRDSALSPYVAITVSIQSWQDLGFSHYRFQAQSLLSYLLFSACCSCSQVDRHQPLLKSGSFSSIFLFPVQAGLGSQRGKRWKWTFRLMSVLAISACLHHLKHWINYVTAHTEPFQNCHLRHPV